MHWAMELEAQAIPACSKVSIEFLGLRVRLLCCDLVLSAGLVLFALFRI